MSALIPLKDRIILIPHQLEEINKPSILLTTSVKESPWYKIVATGEGVSQYLLTGDIVMCDRYGLTSFKHENQEFYLAKEESLTILLNTSV